MNGTFTSDESKHLSLDERRHYLSLGLCAPVDGMEFESFVDEATEAEVDKKFSEEVEYLERLREEELTRHCIFVAEVYACLETRSIAEIGAKLVALLDET